MKPEVAYWIDSANEDLEVSRVLLEKNRLLHAGFFCHLTIEKSFKAVLAARDEVVPHIHNLQRLAERCALIGEMSDGQLTLLDELNPLNIEGRYPSTKKSVEKSLTRSYCENLLCETGELAVWISQKLEN